MFPTRLKHVGGRRVVVHGDGVEVLRSDDAHKQQYQKGESLRCMADEGLDWKTDESTHQAKNILTDEPINRIDQTTNRLTDRPTNQPPV